MIAEKLRYGSRKFLTGKESGIVERVEPYSPKKFLNTLGVEVTLPPPFQDSYGNLPQQISFRTPLEKLITEDAPEVLVEKGEIVGGNDWFDPAVFDYGSSLRDTSKYAYNIYEIGDNFVGKSRGGVVNGITFIGIGAFLLTVIIGLSTLHIGYSLYSRTENFLKKPNKKS